MDNSKPLFPIPREPIHVSYRGGRTLHPPILRKGASAAEPHKRHHPVAHDPSKDGHVTQERPERQRGRSEEQCFRKQINKTGGGWGGGLPKIEKKEFFKKKDSSLLVHLLPAWKADV